MFTVILDNGHGADTKGKCSPEIDFQYNKDFTSIENGRYREYIFSRRVVLDVKRKLEKLGFNVIQLVPEMKDILLKERVRRINQYCSKYGAGNCVLVSVHSNAAGNGDWMSGRGWSIWTTRGQNNSDKLASCIYEAAKEHIEKDEKYTAKQKIRTDFKDGDADYESNFYIIKGANCPAVLIENMFHDNREDVKYLESWNGFSRICNTIVDGVKNYADKYGKK